MTVARNWVVDGRLYPGSRLGCWGSLWSWPSSRASSSLEAKMLTLTFSPAQRHQSLRFPGFPFLNEVATTWCPPCRPLSLRPLVPIECLVPLVRVVSSLVQSHSDATYCHNISATALSFPGLSTKIQPRTALRSPLSVSKLTSTDENLAQATIEQSSPESKCCPWLAPDDLLLIALQTSRLCSIYTYDNGGMICRKI